MLERVLLKGYKSIREAEITLRPINVLIGANGAGKSNFISLFQFMNRLAAQGMQTYVAQAGGADQILHYGRKTTERLDIELWFTRGSHLANGYTCTLIPTADDLFVFDSEIIYFHDRQLYQAPYSEVLRSPRVHHETLLNEWDQAGNAVAHYVLAALNSWRLYHFHDTSASARVKQTGDIHDNLFLRPDASNLAAYLYLLRENRKPTTGTSWRPFGWQPPFSAISYCGPRPSIRRRSAWNGASTARIPSSARTPSRMAPSVSSA